MYGYEYIMRSFKTTNASGSLCRSRLICASSHPIRFSDPANIACAFSTMPKHQPALAHLHIRKLESPRAAEQLGLPRSSPCTAWKWHSFCTLMTGMSRNPPSFPSHARLSGPGRARMARSISISSLLSDVAAAAPMLQSSIF